MKELYLFSLMPYMASSTIMDINEYKSNALGFWNYYIDLYGIEPNFKTFIDNQAVASSKEHVKEKFEFYKMGWSLIGKDVSNAQKVYEVFFNDKELNYSFSLEDAISENKKIVENAQDPNVKLYEPNYMKDIYKNSSIINTSDDEDVFRVKCQNCKTTIYKNKKTKKAICEDCKNNKTKINNSSNKILLVVFVGLIIYFFRGYSLAIIAVIGIILGFLYDEFGRKK